MWKADTFIYVNSRLLLFANIETFLVCLFVSLLLFVCLFFVLFFCFVFRFFFCFLVRVSLAFCGHEVTNKIALSSRNYIQRINTRKSFFKENL